MVGDGTDLFWEVNGVRIARRGRPNTPQARMWISLEPGWQVLDGKDLKTTVITYNGVRVH
jgi:hypothetical protein